MLEETCKPPEKYIRPLLAGYTRDPDTREKLTNILNKYVDIFSDRVGHIKLIEYDIIFKKSTPIALKPYPFPNEKQSIINNMVKDMEEQDLVEPSTSQ